MRKVYLLEDLCCANCAAKIEKKIAALDGVDSASVNFLTTKLVMEVQESLAGDLDAAVRKIVRKVEPDVTVTEVSK
jgi:Cd2+/Zn2+-exporting ATPase